MIKKIKSLKKQISVDSMSLNELINLVNEIKEKLEKIKYSLGEK